MTDNTLQNMTILLVFAAVVSMLTGIAIGYILAGPRLDFGCAEVGASRSTGAVWVSCPPGPISVQEMGSITTVGCSCPE